MMRAVTVIIPAYILDAAVHYSLRDHWQPGHRYFQYNELSKEEQRQVLDWITQEITSNLENVLFPWSYAVEEVA